MLFKGYGPLLWEGTLMTVKLSIFSLLLSFLIGLIGAAAKLSSNRLLSGAGTTYTTVIRGVPDLLLMLLLFYSLQGWLNTITESMKMAQIDIDPLTAGVLTLGFIYGAYFAETFRGAFLSVPTGQLEAGAAYGMNRWQVFHRILFPQMMRFALPGISNNWQVLVKSTALVSIIGLSDIVKNAGDAGKGSREFFFFIAVAGLIYLAITTLSNFVLMWLERRYDVGVRSAEL